MKNTDLFVTRREMLSRCGMGMGAVALDTAARRDRTLRSIRWRRSSRRCPRKRSAFCTCS